jgi:hypothetical protein
MTIASKYPRKFKVIREQNSLLRKKQLSQLKHDPYTNAELRGFLRDLFDNDIRYNINTHQLKKTYGKHKLYKLLNNAIEIGYIQRNEVLTRYNNHQGYRKDYHYILAEMPIFRPNFESDLIEKKSVLECPHFECTLKWDSKENKVKKEKKEKKKPKVCKPEKLLQKPNGDKPPNPPLLFFERDQVRIKKEIYDSLIEEYTEPIVTMAIERMNAYIHESGKYLSYTCHGAKLRSWLAKDAAQYQKKLQKQEQEEQNQRENDAYAQQLALIEAQKQQKELEQKTINDAREAKARANESIVEKYMEQHATWIKMDSRHRMNGVYQFMGEYQFLHEDNVEEKIQSMIQKQVQSERDFAESCAGYGEVFKEHQVFKEHTERHQKCDEINEVVCSVKKTEIEAKISHSVLNLSYPVEKSPRKMKFQNTSAQIKWKSQLNSVLKSYGRYPMQS